jgi:nucleoside-diphosphate-sugar epimerase
MRNVFLTGGAGFLGRAIMRWAALDMPDVRFTVYSRDDSKHSYARREFPQLPYVLGDIRDADRLEIAMAGHDTVDSCGRDECVDHGRSSFYRVPSVPVLS